MFWYDPLFCLLFAILTNEDKGTFFPGLEGFEEIQNPDTDIFRIYGMSPPTTFLLSPYMH